MTWWQQLRQRFGKRKPPPIIQTEWGPVSEQMRQRAAYRMKMEPEVKARVEEMIGEAEAKVRYPEAYAK